MERAGNFSKDQEEDDHGLPVVELGLTDFVGFIPTNLMSMTDATCFFPPDFIIRASGSN